MHQKSTDCPQEVIANGSMKSQTERGLRFAVLLDEWRMTAWQVECVSLLVMSGACELELMIGLTSPSRRRILTRLNEVCRHGLWFAFMATFGRAQTNREFRNNPFLATRSTIQIKNTRESFAAGNSDLALVEQSRLDFILYLGSKPLEPDSFRLARYGVWTFRFGALENSGGYPPLVREMLQQEPITCVTLEQHTPDNAAPTVLRRGFFPITPHSYARSLDVAVSGSLDFPLLACQELLANTRPSVLAQRQA